ncbi:MAG: T9SS type A sorting domain-containing protein [Bacteroidota bacterium]
MYKTGLIKTPSFALTISKNVKTGEEKIWLPGSNFYIESNYRTRIVFEILGRMIHLLGDMSVPAHVHTDDHRSSIDETYEGEYMHLGTDNDPYDNSNVNYWSAQKVWSDFGSIMSPYVSNDTPLHHLMYTLNQITAHFASFHYDGDDTKANNNSELNQYFPIGVAPSSSSTYSNPYYPYTKTILHENIRNATFPHAIRATAGLLYWFAKEADLLPIPITGVSLIGTEILYQGATGVWGATAQNGLEPFTYNWQIKYVDGGGYLQSFASVKAEKEKKDKEKKKDGEIIINLAPSNEWVPLGLNSDVLTRPHNPTDLRDYYLKCSITDASGTTKTSNEWFVDVTADPLPVNPPQTNTLSADNLKSEMNALSKENEIVETPKSYSLEQNYPNPFNPVTRISYSIAESGFVTLKVFDILGREVSTLVNEVKPTGRFEVEFNASELPTGTYIYRLTAGNYQTINKMLLLK